MKVSDYIVEFFMNKEITDVFGYPGGMVTHLMDSLAKHTDGIKAHVMYHEQAAAFAACAYGQVSGKPGVAYATSGPGATNLITGICNAFFDSIPTIFITGQVNCTESKKGYAVRQRGFQETDIVSIVKPITKYASKVEDPRTLPKELERAYKISVSDRKGPVLLDIPMDVFRAEIEIDEIKDDECFTSKQELNDVMDNMLAMFSCSKAPVFLIGNGVKMEGAENRVRKALDRLGIPVVSSMIAFDVMRNSPCFFGFVGAYGARTANFVVAKSDLIITIGSRLDIRQVGANRERFAENAKILRFDVDEGELSYKVHEDEMHICADMETICEALESVKIKRYDSWVDICNEIRSVLSDVDKSEISTMVERLSQNIIDNAVITTDVGQNQVWIAQYFKVKENQKVLFSGGHGAMGYSLPAAIGAFYGSGSKSVYCFAGDGGMQMNIQELQYLFRENIPVKIIVFNNNALGMIRHFQEMYFENRYFQTKPEGGYTAPDFAKIAEAYGIKSQRVSIDELDDIQWSDGPELLEVMIQGNTYVTPKLRFGEPNQDQEPLIDRSLYKRIMDMNP